MSEPDVCGLSGSHEIVELTEEYDSKTKVSICSGKPLMNRSIEDDINKLFAALDVGSSFRGIHLGCNLNKSVMKRPMSRVSPLQASGIGILEPVSLKQALRGLCISQASEMAAMKKRMLRPPAIPEARAAKKSCGLGEGKPSRVKIFLLPDRTQSSISNIFSKMNGPLTKGDEGSRLNEMGEISQSSNSSIEYYGPTMGNGEESCLSTSSHKKYRPYMSKDTRWEAISDVREQLGSLRWRDFKLLRKIGGRDSAMLYVCELIGTNCLFAAKVVDNDESLMSKKKMVRAQTEKEILEIIDHPFLPTLCAHFVMDKFSCLVTEYCPGGNLRVLEQKRPDKSFTEREARFYAAEVLLGLEYLHMLGVVHQGLKPENILIRENGHIMLTGLDSSLRCTMNPQILKSSSPIVKPPKNLSGLCSGQLSCQLSCLPVAAKARKLKPEAATPVIPVLRLIVEPTTAQSDSFAGMHEYLAPEIIKRDGHGSAADWWAFGIVLYELLYGRTPFKGLSNDETTLNITSQCLDFPQCPITSPHARDLITRLLMKEPVNRLGAAAEIKQHPFFDGLNWALMCRELPPELP